MTYRRSFVVACIILGLAPCALLPHRAFAQGSNDPIAKVPILLQVLERDGFEALKGDFRTIDLVPMACAGGIPTTWFNNLQPYMTVVLPDAWENTTRVLPVT